MADQINEQERLAFIRKCVADNPGGFTEDFKFLLSLVDDYDLLRDALEWIKDINKPISVYMDGTYGWLEGEPKGTGGGRMASWRIADAALTIKGGK